MPSLRQRVANVLLHEEQQKLNGAIEVFSDMYQRWPSIIRQSMTQAETEKLGEMDSRMLDLMQRQLNNDFGQVSGYESTEADRRLAVDLSRRSYDNDVLMEAVIDSWSSFGFGTKVDIVPRDPEAKPAWDAFWSRPLNAYLLGQKRIADLSTYLLRDGDYLLVYYISALDGSVAVRRVSTFEIQGGPQNTGVICLPEDREVPVLYRRQVTAQPGSASQLPQVQYFRDWRATDAMVEEVRTHDGWHFDDGVMIDELKETTRVVAQLVAHKVRSLRGWPLMTTGLPWSTAYKNFLQDRAAIARAAAMYFEKLKVKGGSRAIDQLVGQMQSTLVTSSNTMERNPTPAAGSLWMENDQAERSRFPMGTGAGDAETDGAMLKAQAALAGRMPSHWLGSGKDVQWATAQEMRIPVLRALNGYGLFWSATWAEMVEIVLTADERYNPERGGRRYQTYEVDVNTDALLTTEVEQVTALMTELEKATVDGVWPAADFAQVYPYLVRLALQSVGIRNVDDVLPSSKPVANRIAMEGGDPKAGGTTVAEARPLGPERYQASLRNAARGLWAGALDGGEFYAMLANAIEVGLTDAWHAGAREVGVESADYSPEELAALAQVIATEYGYVAGLADYIHANSKAAGGKLGDLEGRLHQWALRWGSTHDQAMAMAGKDQPMMWTLGPTESHCTDCEALDGKVKRGSYWTAAGILPRVPALACTGINCGCSLVVTDKPITRGPLPKLAGPERK